MGVPKKGRMTPHRVPLIFDAREFALEKHEGINDDAGLDYFEAHLIVVASLIRQVSDDEELIAAAYLHDTLEDTDTTYEELVENFGPGVADLVVEVTQTAKKNDEGVPSFGNLRTQRGIMLKFADRLSNLSRMEPWSEERQQRYLDRSQFWIDDPYYVKEFNERYRCEECGEGYDY